MTVTRDGATVARVGYDGEGRLQSLWQPAGETAFTTNNRGFDGAAYRSANWIPVGRTQGCGKLDRRREFARPVKDIYLKPLRHDWKLVLNQ